MPNGDITYSIVVQNTGTMGLSGIVITDTLPDSLTNLRGLNFSGSGASSVNTSTSGFDGQVLTVNISGLDIAQSVSITFVATVAPNMPLGTTITNNAMATASQNVSDESSASTRVTDDSPELIKNPDRMTTRVGETINWTLRGFHNRSGEGVTNFTILDLPGQGLNFSSGTLPAFTNGEGITYEIRYRVAGSTTWNIYQTGIDAAQPFSFSLPQPGNLWYTHIGFFFGDVPASFGLNNEIILSFIVGDDAPNGVLINNFVVQYSDVEREGYSPDTPIIVPGTSIGETPTQTYTPQQPTQTPTQNPPNETGQSVEGDGAVIDTLSVEALNEGNKDVDVQRINPQTGDNINLMLIAFAALGLAASIATLLIVGRSKKKQVNR